MKFLQKYRAYFFPGLIVLSVIIYLRNILFPDSSQIVFGGDVLTQFYFWKGFLVDSLKSGTIPFWNPYVFSGTPFLAHPATAFFYPATLFYLFLPLNLSFTIVYSVHLIIAGWGIYALTKKYTDRLSAFLAALFCVFSGYFAARIYLGHVDILTTAVWIPWIILSFVELREGFTFKRFIKAVFFFALMILAGYTAYVVFTGEFIVFFIILNLFKAKFWKNSKSILIIIRPVIISLIFGIGITAIQWLPTWQLTRESIRGKGLPYELSSWGSLPISSWKLLFNPFDSFELNKISYGLLGGKAPNSFDHYSGSLVVILIIIFGFTALISLKTGFKYRKMFSLPVDFWLYIIFSLYSSAVAIGYNLTPNLHALLYDFTPFYRFIRIPAQHLVFPVFLIPVMAGIIIGKFNNNTIKLLLGVLSIYQLFIYSDQYIYLTNVPEKEYDKKLIEVFSKQTELIRILPNFRVVSPVLNALDFNAADKYNFQSTAGYDPVILNNYYYLIDVLNGSKTSSIYSYNVEVPPLNYSPETFNYLNIKYLITEKSADSVFGNKYKKLIDAPIYSLFENDTYLSRFYLVNKVEVWGGKPYSDLSSSVLKREIIVTDNNDNIYTRDITDCSDNNSDDIQVVSYEQNRIKLNVSTKCATLLTGIENNYPGWKAKIDNVNTKLITGNFIQRTIKVPKGVHSVEFYYDPIIYYAGLLITATSIISLILIYRHKRYIA